MLGWFPGSRPAGPGPGNKAKHPLPFYLSCTCTATHWDIDQLRRVYLMNIINRHFGGQNSRWSKFQVVIDIVRHVLDEAIDIGAH